jgi:hypothetical protein
MRHINSAKHKRCITIDRMWKEGMRAMDGTPDEMLHLLQCINAFRGKDHNGADIDIPTKGKGHWKFKGKGEVAKGKF